MIRKSMKNREKKNFVSLRKNIKAMSPVVATILLIAIVIIIAVIIFLWMKRAFVPEIIEKNGEDVASIVCSKVKFRAEYSSGKLEISNDGNVPIQNIKLKIVSDGDTVEKELITMGVDWPQFGLGKSRVYSSPGTFKSKAGINAATDKIIVIPILRGTSKSGYQDKVCDEQYGIPLNV